MLKVLIGQLGVGAMLAAVLWGFFGRVAGTSALLGVLTCVLPNAFQMLTAPSAPTWAITWTAI